MLGMYTRSLVVPDHSFFLFGPRAVGKSTWLRKVLPEAHWFDLLRTETFLRLSRSPGDLRQEILALPAGCWVVIDEVQRCPTLLNEVHALLAECGDRYRFAMSGSSARKLRRLDVNLLAGRVFDRRMLPLTASELGDDFDVMRVLRFGSLPKVASEPQHAVDILEAYVLTYLQEEIRQEAFVKDLGAFSRFLEVVASCNGQIVNVASVARDAGVARPTVQRYFEVLIDTLIAVWLPAWRPRFKIKVVAKPKFYLFDPGVVRALCGLLRDPLERGECGPLLETWVLHELRAAIAYQGVGGTLAYYRTTAGTEIDFIWSRAKRHVAIEVKSSKRWRPEWGKALNSLVSEGAISSAFGVYLGDRILVDGPITVLPIQEFVKRLGTGEVLH